MTTISLISFDQNTNTQTNTQSFAQTEGMIGAQRMQAFWRIKQQYVFIGHLSLWRH